VRRAHNGKTKGKHDHERTAKIIIRAAVAAFLSGIHHVTAIAGEPQRNLDFYAGVLGLRLVKQTINYDDPNTYHLYYGDALGRPGTILTFFPWPGARRGRHGTGQATVTTLSVPAGSLRSGPSDCARTTLILTRRPGRTSPCSPSRTRTAWRWS
jgi:glyoxalase family protein